MLENIYHQFASFLYHNKTVVAVVLGLVLISVLIYIAVHVKKVYDKVFYKDKFSTKGKEFPLGQQFKNKP